MDVPLAIGFTAGMLATFNPCGIAMLPAYLSFFVGGAGRPGTFAPLAAAQALRVGAAMTAGFAAVFAVAGVAAGGLSLSVARHAPWATLVIGLALVPVGLAVATGWGPSLSLPRLQRGGSGRGLVSMALFGMSYATVSLSCTLPVFLAAVSTTFPSDAPGTGVAVFLAYAAGMGVVVTGLTLAVALARESLVERVRGAVRHVQRASGLLLAAAGAYVAWYGWFSLRVAAGDDVAAGPVEVAERLSGRISTWIDGVGGLRLGLAIATAAVAVVALEWRRRRAGAGSSAAGDPSPVVPGSGGTPPAGGE